MKNKWLWLVLGSLVLATSAFVFHSCGGGDGGTPSGSSTTISAKLYSGTVGPINPMVAKAATPDAPLAGYQLYCVTFSTPPLSGKGTSGTDGSVTLTLDVGSADLGCFILDANGTSVASLIFTNSDLTQSGQTISAGGTADFGTITVSLEYGVATATIPSGVTIDTTTPSGVSCPEGTWEFLVDAISPLCSSPTSGTMWIAQIPDGTYVASFTAYNIGDMGECVTWSQSNIPLTVNGNTLSAGPFADIDTPRCPGKTRSFEMTANATCTTATGTSTPAGCAAGSDACSCSECYGATTCTIVQTATRE